ncbi:MAG: pyridoxine 5'-phosphate synthase [Enterobacteriaceae bacterium]
MEKLLGVNIDHFASLRNLRKNVFYPDPVQAVFIAEDSGADNITVHLREDRRHITERDLYIIKKIVKTRMNLEISTNEDMINIACKIKPDSCCLVPEKRYELTTESGLNINEKNMKYLELIINKLKKNNVQVSIFLNPEKDQVDKALNVGATDIEIHTGFYADSKDRKIEKEEIEKIRNTAKYANSLGLNVNAGHGLNYQNIKKILKIKYIREFNIGHSIISYALIYGLKKAVINMKKIIKNE